MNRYVFLDPENEVRKLIDADAISADFNGQLKKISELIKYEIVFCINTVNDYNRYLMSRIHSENYNVKVVVLQDGIYDWNNSYYNRKHLKRGVKLYDPVIADFFFYVGGGEGVDYVKFQNSSVCFFQYKPKRMLLPKGVNPMKSKISKVLITTANTAYFDELEFECLVKLLRLTIKSSLEAYDEVLLRIFDSRLSFLVDEFNLSNIVNCTFSDSIYEVQAVITTPSTIAIEAMAAGKAVAILDYRDSPLLVQSGWRITGSEIIKLTLNSMKLMDDDRMNYQSSIVAKALKNNDLPSLLNVVSTADLEDVKSRRNLKEAEVQSLLVKGNILDSRMNINFYLMLKRFMVFLGFRK